MKHHERLFSLMQQEHGLDLLEGDMDAIRRAVFDDDGRIDSAKRILGSAMQYLDGLETSRINAAHCYCLCKKVIGVLEVGES